MQHAASSATSARASILRGGRQASEFQARRRGTERHAECDQSRHRRSRTGARRGTVRARAARHFADGDGRGLPVLRLRSVFADRHRHATAAEPSRGSPDRVELRADLRVTLAAAAPRQFSRALAEGERERRHLASPGRLSGRRLRFRDSHEPFAGCRRRVDPPVRRTPRARVQPRLSGDVARRARQPRTTTRDADSRALRERGLAGMARCDRRRRHRHHRRLARRHDPACVRSGRHGPRRRARQKASGRRRSRERGAGRSRICRPSTPPPLTGW